MATQHTPGPWEAAELTTVFSIRSRDTSVAVVQSSGRANRFGEARANAHLIAAAPELYEALLEARVAVAADVEEASDPEGRHHNFLQVFVDRLAMIDAALAKARGETA